MAKTEMDCAVHPLKLVKIQNPFGFLQINPLQKNKTKQLLAEWGGFLLKIYFMGDRFTLLYRTLLADIFSCFDAEATFEFSLKPTPQFTMDCFCINATKKLTQLLHLM